MPTIIYQRWWCHKCQDYTLFHHNECNICESEMEDYILSEVPEDKILEQRDRYKAYKKKKFEDMLSLYGMNRNILEELLYDSPISEIIETDAGQNRIDEEKRKKRERIIQEQKEKAEEYNLFYKKANRNDPCPCGSGNKYKHCCLPKFHNT